MSSYFINGAKYAFATALGAAVPITAISNADPAVATGTAPPTNSLVLLESNWTDLSGVATYTGAGSGGSFPLLGISTLDQGIFPPGEGAGSYRVASTFVSLSQIRDIQQAGGDSNNFNFGYVDDASRKQRSKPTDTNPLVLTFIMDYDPALPWYEALETASRKGEVVVFRERLPTGDVLVYSGYLAFNKSPTRVRNENMTVQAVLSVNGEVLRFPASQFSGS